MLISKKSASGAFMKYVYLLIFLQIFVSCKNNNDTAGEVQIAPQISNTTTKMTVLFCGKIHYGCEDVSNDTLSIEIVSRDKINIIRQFHNSEIPITSAFVGKFNSETEIVATYNRELTEKSWRKVQDKFPSGEILLILSCSDLKTYQGCIVSAKAVNINEMGKYPGWDAEYNAPNNLPCNLKEFQSTQASEKDCQKS